MEIVSFQSTAIARSGYADGALFIKFVSGEWYKYVGVPESLYSQLLAAPSKGKFVNQRIKPFYRVKPLTNPELEMVRHAVP